MPEKKKLTLSVDSEIVEKAKKIGINISEITENVLKHYTFEVDDANSEEIIYEYKQLFKSVVPLLKKFGTGVNIGSHELEPSGQYCADYYLTQEGNVETYTDDEPEIPKLNKKIDAITSNDVEHFYDPMKIINNLFGALVRGAERRKERLSELKMARKLLEVVNMSLEVKESKKTQKNGEGSEAR